MSIRLMATDLDNTFLREDKSISEASLAALDLCRRKGILIAICTARSAEDCLPVLDEMKPDAVISFAGALVRYGEEVLYRQEMSAQVVDQLLKTAKKYPAVQEIAVQGEEGSHRCSLEEGWLKEDTVFPEDHLLGAPYTLPALKCVMKIADEEEARAIGRANPECDTLRYAGTDWYRFVHKEVSKGGGLAALAEALNIELANVMAFGDDWTDISMLSACGYGCAVDNAIPEAKKAARYTTGSNEEDGVAQFIFKMLKDS